MILLKQEYVILMKGGYVILLKRGFAILVKRALSVLQVRENLDTSPWSNFWAKFWCGKTTMYSWYSVNGLFSVMITRNYNQMVYRVSIKLDWDIAQGGRINSYYLCTLINCYDKTLTKVDCQDAVFRCSQVTICQPPCTALSLFWSDSPRRKSYLHYNTLPE